MEEVTMSDFLAKGLIRQFRGIIWDWNGTLLDDNLLAVECMNRMLIRRGLPVLSIERYKDVFTFPVQDYYQRVGFDFDIEPFEIPALEFIDQYNSLVRDCSLQKKTIEVLTCFRNCGIRQYILSAMQQETLDQCLDHYQINHFFEKVSGLDDHYAKSKLDTGLLMIRELHLDPGELLLIGDTVHDFEVASALGCSCILVSNGHQSHERLVETGVPVIEDLLQLLS